jgi:hypothetical protein
MQQQSYLGHTRSLPQDKEVALNVHDKIGQVTSHSPLNHINYTKKSINIVTKKIGICNNHGLTWTLSQFGLLWEAILVVYFATSHETYIKVVVSENSQN